MSSQKMPQAQLTKYAERLFDILLRKKNTLVRMVKLGRILVFSQNDSIE